MRTLSIGWMLVVAAAGAGGAQAWAASPAQGFSTTVGVDSILAEVRKAEKGLKDVAFNFTQRTALKGTGEAQEVSGEVRMLHSPERFRVDYTSPVRQVAIYDGKALLLYLPEARQAFRQKADLAEIDRMVGFNPASMLDAFEGGYTAESRGCSEGKCSLVFRPHDATRPSWNIVLSTGNWMVDEVSFETGDMTMSIRCTGYRLNGGISPGVFKFKFPPDTEVIDGIPMLMGPSLGKDAGERAATKDDPPATKSRSKSRKGRDGE